jgi:hypothetical protein
MAVLAPPNFMDLADIITESAEVNCEYTEALRNLIKPDSLDSAILIAENHQVDPKIVGAILIASQFHGLLDFDERSRIFYEGYLPRGRLLRAGLSVAINCFPPEIKNTAKCIYIAAMIATVCIYPSTAKALVPAAIKSSVELIAPFSDTEMLDSFRGAAPNLLYK